MVAREHIGAQIAPRDGEVGSSLNERPPLGFQKDLAREPVRNGLLRDGLMSDLAHTGSQGGLRPPGDGNSALKRCDVTFLHERSKYTNRFVYATTPFVLQPDKGVCNVLEMSTHRSTALKRPAKVAKPRREKRKALPGQDGKTLGQRLSEAMAFKSGRLGYEYRATDLLRDVNRLAQSSPDSPFLTQQMLSAILRNTVTKTSKTPYLAMACGVSAAWMTTGIGKMTDHLT